MSILFEPVRLGDLQLATGDSPPRPTAAVQVGTEALTQAQEEVVIAGERNLLAVSDFSSDLGQLRARAASLLRARDRRRIEGWVHANVASVP